MRNLNDVEVGGRPLRLDYADADPMIDNSDRRGDMRGRGAHNNAMPLLPEGVPIAPGVSATDVITQTIASLPPNQLMDILTQMKSLTTHAPEQARHLLISHPQLAYAIFHAMLMMNVVDPAVVQRVVNETGPASGFPAVPPGSVMGPALGAPPLHPMHPDPIAARSPQPPLMPAPGPSPIPTAAPAPVAAPAPMLHAPQLDEQQRQLLHQVLQLTPEQIQALPPEQRAGILQLKAQFGH